MVREDQIGWRAQWSTMSSWHDAERIRLAVVVEHGFPSCGQVLFSKPWPVESGLLGPRCQNPANQSQCGGRVKLLSAERISRCRSSSRLSQVSVGT